MIKYNKPYPTIGELIKDKDYDYVSYRMLIPGFDEENGEFAGCFSSKNGEIIPLDYDTYYESEEVIASEEWNMPKEGIENGLTVVVEGEFL
ncbi:hypothetical protein [Blautia obeum]|uniref:Uncharacterized protein n=1 Tax=Blautia obeum TaxID=40520 RepID=A0A415HVP1_9FIRM|nr:hypothetical protein [Blautia obeum]RHK98313.1 hypothetical protein DW040_03115 [Blautia obeum]